MKKYSTLIIAGGLLLSVFISNMFSLVRDGRRLDKLRNSVLRLHILANSDSEHDQRLKLCVRDELLSHADEIFDDAEDLEEAEESARRKLPLIKQIAEDTLKAHRCNEEVTVELADVEFDERVYGDITMPCGIYRALRVKIGKAEGHNWWCVMYPPLCIPAASKMKDNKDAEEDFFDEEERDILYHPKKYRVRFAIWDKIKSLLD